MIKEIAKIGIYGDLHLCDHAYGAHTDYPRESLEYFHEITKITESHNLTHLIGTGDFTFGRFNTLEYRVAIEKELARQNEITNGNHYEIMGNHDSATNGMTEYEYYTLKGLIKRSTNLTLGSVNITMLDYLRSGKYTQDMMNIEDTDDTINVVIAHQYFKFTDSLIPDFMGNAIILDDFTPFFGADYLLCGHIHRIMGFSGSIVKDSRAHKLTVQYLGCMMRPSYREGELDTKGNMTILTIRNDGSMDYDVVDIPLWPIEDSFNIGKKQKEKEKKQEKAERVDISDIVSQLSTHSNSIGDPEDIIQKMDNVADKYKNKALQLLRSAE